ncbi:MAG TPA: hypothetical protein VGT78_05750 [Rhizomicrobium sp.]|nr:hypothetical protein [Rhizomicrobium sp.]
MTAGIFSTRNIAAAILIAGTAASLVVNYPGHMEFDGIMQMAEGHTGIYSNWHPPVMSWLLGISEAVRGDAWLFVLFDTLMAFGALLSLLWLVEKPRAPSIGVALLCAALPQFFLFGAIVWKDVLFANALLAGFVFLAHAAARWNRRGVRFVCLAGAAIFIALAVLARQSGAVVLPCAAVATGLIAAQSNGVRKALAYGLGFLMASAFLCVGANALLQLRASNALGPIEELEDLELYDLAGMLQQHPDLPMPILEREAPAMAHALRENGPKLYTPAMHDPLTDPPVIHSLITASVAPVRRQWIASVRANLGLYLSVRTADFDWLFFSQHPDRCLTYTLGVDGPVAQMKMLKLPRRYDGRDNWLEENYAGALIGTPAFSHPFFTVIGIVCLILLLWRRRPADLALAAMLAAALLYAATYFVIAVACQYRYLFALDTSALAALFYLSMDWSGLSARTRRSNASP